MRDKLESDTGMTLVEVLVSLTLLALLSTALLGSIRVGGQAFSAVVASSNAMDDVVLTQRFLRRQLSQAVSPSNVTDPGDQAETNIRFSGEGAHLVFTAPWLTAIGQGALFNFRIFREDNNLMLSWRPTVLTADEVTARDNELIGERILVEGVTGLQIRYYGTTVDGGRVNWRAAWADRTHLPRLLRFDVEFEEGHRTRWPAFFVMLAS